jgi:hypothetical protein
MEPKKSNYRPSLPLHSLHSFHPPHLHQFLVIHDDNDDVDSVNDDDFIPYDPLP